MVEMVEVCREWLIVTPLFVGVPILPRNRAPAADAGEGLGIRLRSLLLRVAFEDERDERRDGHRVSLLRTNVRKKEPLRLCHRVEAARNSVRLYWW